MHKPLDHHWPLGVASFVMIAGLSACGTISDHASGIQAKGSPHPSVSAASTAPPNDGTSAVTSTSVASTTSTTTHVLTVGPAAGAYVPGTPPTYCTTSYQSSSRPPQAAPEVAEYLLTSADVPANLEPQSVGYANVPTQDEIAAGFPNYPIAEASFATSSEQQPSFGIYEILGKTRSARAAASTFEFARDHIYGDCNYFWGDGTPVQIQLPQSGPDLIAFEILAGTSYSSSASATVLGYKGDYVFDLSIGNSIGYPDTQKAALPTVTQTAQVVNATLARIPS
jgi:hypothetical protein